MASKLVNAKNWLWANKNIINLVRSKLPANISFQLPEKYKGTVVEKWAIYWRHLMRDYKEVGSDLIKESKARPVKASIILSVLGFLAYAGKTNPDENTFRDNLLTYANELLLVSSPVRNPASCEHLAYMEHCYNAGLIRRMSLGVASLIWIDNYDKSVGLYEAQCEYLKPKYLTFHERVVDVGFLSRYWNLDRKMNDYDVNESEFIN